MAREHSYRGDLEELIRELVQGVEITNESANVMCGEQHNRQFPTSTFTPTKPPMVCLQKKAYRKKAIRQAHCTAESPI